MVDVVVALVAFVMGVGALQQWWRSRRRPWQDPSRCLAVTMTSVAASAGLFTMPANEQLSAWSGISNVAEPLARTALIVSVWAGVRFVRMLAESEVGAQPRRAWGRTCMTSSVVTWATFVAAPTSSALRVIGGGRVDVWLAVYTAAWMAPVAVGLSIIIGQTRRHAGPARGAVATGVRLVEAGCWSGLAYAVVKLVTTASSVVVTGDWPLDVQALVGRLLGAVAGLLVLIGCTLPLASRAWASLKLLAWAHRCGLRLYALWRDSVAAFPELRLHVSPGVTAEALSPWAADERLYRRVVELRDVQLQLALPENSNRRAQLPHVIAALDGASPTTRPQLDHSRQGYVGRRDEVQWWLDAASRYQRSRRGASQDRGVALLEEVQ